MGAAVVPPQAMAEEVECGFFAVGFAICGREVVRGFAPIGDDS